MYTLEYRDLASSSEQIASPAQDAWYTPLKGSYELSFDAISRWKMTGLGRYVTDWFVYALEKVGFAPPGTQKVSKCLNEGADALVRSGELELFTPMFFFLVRKPDDGLEYGQDDEIDQDDEVDHEDEIDYEDDHERYEDEEIEEDL